jgi:hypothetical protein
VRALFLILLCANAAFFAWRYYVEQLAPPKSDPLAQQIEPERVRIVLPDELPRVAASRRQAACVELGPIAAVDGARAEEAVNALAAGLQVSSRKADEPARWWVYVPPAATRAAAVQRIAELRKQGVEDSSLVNDDPQWRNAVSLGVFRSEEAATKRLEDLRRRGVRGAEMAARDAPGARVYIQLRDAPEPVRARLGEVRERFPGAELRECPGG